MEKIKELLNQIEKSEQKRLQKKENSEIKEEKLVARILEIGDVAKDKSNKEILKYRKLSKLVNWRELKTTSLVHLQFGDFELAFEVGYHDDTWKLDTLRTFRHNATYFNQLVLGKFNTSISNTYEVIFEELATFEEVLEENLEKTIENWIEVQLEKKIREI